MLPKISVLIVTYLESNQKYLDIAASSCTFIIKDLSITNTENGICFSYTPIDTICVHNANALGAAVLSRLYSITKNQMFRDYAEKARNNKLTLEEMQGGTFTITNGGVFGSMLSTPIINAPQSAILGMHNIVERPVALNGEVVIRPIMYLALSYDHRIIDGKESVSFLKTIKELLEDPARILLAV
jgi:2-oxoglutarate dehydrogenase E2 component (dihydrolipoamide succinyltransferase)